MMHGTIKASGRADNRFTIPVAFATGPEDQWVLAVRNVPVRLVQLVRPRGFGGGIILPLVQIHPAGRMIVLDHNSPGRHAIHL